ncbi:MAG: ATP-binding protein, partial [Deltaproteobacteria bacterium]
GIAPEYQQQIFAIFRRLHTDKEYEGTGIGLAIVQKAAQNIGGSVRVESTPGEGSTFFINLKNAILKSENHKSASDG